jgi:hypothetical protein
MPMEFYLWGFVKDQVYQPKVPRNVDELKAMIKVAVTQVTPETLQKEWEALEFWRDACRITSGAHTENL